MPATNGEANLSRDLPAPPGAEEEESGHPGRGGEGPAYEYKDLAVYHEQIIRLKALTPERITNKEIAEAVGVTPQTVSHVLNSSLGQRKLNTLLQHADSAAKDKMEKIGELADYGLAVKEDLLLDPNTPQKLRDKIATDLLDRAGAQKPTEHKVDHTFRKEKMEEIKQRAKANAEVVEPKDVPDDD